MQSDNLAVDVTTRENKEPKLELVELRPNIKASLKLDKLAEALAKAQSEIGSLQRNKSGYNYNYADLAAVLDCIKEPMAKNGLNLMQFPEYNENSEVCPVTTIVTHESGQMLMSTMVVPVAANAKVNDTQVYGSAITYARRYAVMAIMNLAPEDDDGAAAKDYKFKASSNLVATTSPPQTKNASDLKPGIQRAQAINTNPPVSVSICSDCKSAISDERVIEFSMRNFKTVLCRDCQKKHKEAKAS